MPKRKKKEVILIGADTLRETKNFASDKRDQAMYENIKKTITEHNINVVIFPVGSNHIDDDSSAKRLASLIQNDVEVDLKVENFYDSKGKIDRKVGVNTYTLVQQDIDNFKKRHGLSDNIIPIPTKIPEIDDKPQIKINSSVKRKRQHGKEEPENFSEKEKKYISKEEPKSFREKSREKQHNEEMIKQSTISSSSWFEPEHIIPTLQGELQDHLNQDMQTHIAMNEV